MSHDRISHDISQNLADDEIAKLLSVKYNDSSIANYLSIEANGKFHPCLQKLFFDDYIDKNYLRTIPQIRALRDKVTDAYVSGFLQNPDPRNKYGIMDFVNWMYQYVNFIILTDITEKLTNPKYDTPMQKQDEQTIAMAPLNYAESVKLIFKGGTTMHLIYNSILRNMDHEIALAISENNKAREVELNNALKSLMDMKDNFKVSDTDMCIDVSAGDNRRYLSITYATSQLIIKAMEGISNDLEYLFLTGCGMQPLNKLSYIATMEKPAGYDNAKSHKGVTEVTRPDDKGIMRTESINTNVLENLMHEISQAKELYFNISKVQHFSRLWDTFEIDKFDDVTVNNITVKGVHSILREYVLDKDGNVVGSKNPMIVSLLIELIDFYLYHSLNEYSITNNSQYYGEDSEYYYKYIILRNVLKRFAQYSIHLLFDKVRNIYSPENITEFKTHAAKNLTELAGDLVGDLMYDPPRNKLYKLEKTAFTNKDISTSKDIAYRKDVMVHSNDNPIYSTRAVTCTRYNIDEPAKNEGKHLHYISVNNTIVDFFSSNKLDFMLFRIKLNTVVQDIIRPVTIKKTPDNLQGKFKPKMLANGTKGNYKLKPESEILDLVTYDTETRLNKNTGKTETKDILNFKTASEVLDITINDKFDTQKLRKGHYYTYLYHRCRPEKDIGNIIDSHMLTYSTHMHVADISYILFEQGHFLAWMDNKYKKRISRLFIFMGIYQQEVQALMANFTGPNRHLYQINEVLCSSDPNIVNLFNFIKKIDISAEGISSMANLNLINSILDKFSLLGSKNITPEYIYNVSNQYPIYMIIQYHKEIENYKDIFDSIILMHIILYFMDDEKALNILSHTYESIHNLYDRTTLLEQTRKDYKKYLEDLKDIVYSSKTGNGLETIFNIKFSAPLHQTITSVKSITGQSQKRII